MTRELWRVCLSAADAVCHLMYVDGQFALRVKHGSECVLAEMMPDEATALRRAKEVRQTLKRRLRH